MSEESELVKKAFALVNTIKKATGLEKAYLIDQLKDVISRMKNVNVRNENGETLLYYIIDNIYSNYKIIELMINKGADPKLENKDGKNVDSLLNSGSFGPFTDIIPTFILATYRIKNAINEGVDYKEEINIINYIIARFIKNSLKKKDIHSTINLLLCILVRTGHPETVRVVLNTLVSKLIGNINEYQDNLVGETNNSSSPEKDIIIYCINFKCEHPELEIPAQIPIQMKQKEEEKKEEEKKEEDQSMKQTKSSMGKTLTQQLMEALKQRDFETANEIIEEYGPKLLKVKDKNGNTLLHWATGQSAEILKFLVKRFREYNLDINTGNNNGDTPLHILTRFESINTYSYTGESVKILIENGADPNIKNNKNESVLEQFTNMEAKDEDKNMNFNTNYNFISHLLIIGNQEEKKEELELNEKKTKERKKEEDQLKKQTESSKRKTPVQQLMEALKQGDSEAVNEIIEEYGPKLLKVKDENGNTLLHQILMLQKYNKNKFLRTHNKENRNVEKTIEILEFLVKRFRENGLDINARNNNGETPLMYLINNKRQGNIFIIQSLIERCDFDLNARDNNGNTLLHLAVNTKSTALVRHIIRFTQNSNLDINARNNNGDTAMSSLINFKRLTEDEYASVMFKILLDAGGDPNIRNEEGRNVYDLLDEIWRNFSKGQKGGYLTKNCMEIYKLLLQQQNYEISNQNKEEQANEIEQANKEEQAKNKNTNSNKLFTTPKNQNEDAKKKLTKTPDVVDNLEKNKKKDDNSNVNKTETRKPIIELDEEEFPEEEEKGEESRKKDVIWYNGKFGIVKREDYYSNNAPINKENKLTILAIANIDRLNIEEYKKSLSNQTNKFPSK